MMMVVVMLAALAAGLVLVLVRLLQMMVGILFMSVGRMLAELHITSSKVSRGLLCGRVNGEHSSSKHAKNPKKCVKNVVKQVKGRSSEGFGIRGHMFLGMYLGFPHPILFRMAIRSGGTTLGTHQP